jgi:hypothetical protein
MTTVPTPQPPKLIRIIIDYVTDRVLDRALPIAERKLDELKVDALREFEELKTEGLKMITDELPKLAVTISEEAVKTVFEHTQIDESIDKVTSVFDQILGRILPRK